MREYSEVICHMCGRKTSSLLVDIFNVCWLCSGNIHTIPPMLQYVEKLGETGFGPLEVRHTRGIKWRYGDELFGTWKRADDPLKDLGGFGRMLWWWSMLEKHPLLKRIHEILGRLRNFSLTEGREIEEL